MLAKKHKGTENKDMRDMEGKKGKKGYVEPEDRKGGRLSGTGWRTVLTTSAKLGGAGGKNQIGRVQGQC